MTSAEPNHNVPRPAIDSDNPQSKGRSKGEEHDRDLIRSSLELGPEERLAVLQDFVDTFWTPRHG